MNCPRCHAENRPDRRFCGACGLSFVSRCLACGFSNEASERFCGGCGAALAPAAPGGGTRFGPPQSYTPKHLAARILDSKAALEGERKLVTVLFADLQSSMELLADRDPEEARRVLDPVLQLMMAAVHRYEGTVNQVMGDGIMALFGAPLAHEDHATRGCYAALQMQESIKRYAEEVRQSLGVAVRIRVGLNSGEVIVRTIRSDLRMDYTAVGQTTHLASRMEQLADPGRILLTPGTLALAEGFIQVTPLGPTPVKGLAGPVEVYELTGAGPARSRLRASATRGLTRFVGRTTEMAHLIGAMGRARAGHGQLVAVLGEAGVGKSRLCYEFTHSPDVREWVVLETGAVSYGRGTSYSPVVDLLKQYFGIEGRDDHPRVREKVAEKLMALDPALARYHAALLWLLDVPSDDPHWADLDPTQRRRRALDAVRMLLVRESARRPVLLLCEDLHWIDTETQTLLDEVVASLPTARLLLVVTYRPEYEHGWANISVCTQFRVEALPAETTDELLETLLGPDPGLRPLKRLLVQLTDRNPFFLEETVRTLSEVGVLAGEPGAYRQARAIEALQIPHTVQAILAARIDRLPDGAKRLLQSAAVVGTDVPLVLLQEVADEGDADLPGQLAALQAGEFLYESRLFPDFEYTFRHVLTHDVAYGSLSQARRRALHARIAAAVERLRPKRLIEDVDRLAHHTYRGEVWDRAVRYSRQAGAKAQQRSAHREAVAWLEQALAALGHLPAEADTRAQAIDLRLELRGSLYSIGELEKMHGRLREAETLADQLGDARRRGWVSMHLGEYSRQIGHFREASALIQRAREIAGTIDDLPLRLASDQYLGMAFHALGDYRRAAEHERRAAEFPRDEPAPGGFGPTQAGSPAGFRAVSLGWLARCLAEIGEFDEGIEVGREAVRLAEEIDRPYTLVSACWGLGYLHGVRGDLDAATLLLDRALTAARGAGLTRLLPQVMRALGSAYALMGRVADGTSLLEGAVALSESINLRVAESNSLVLLGEVYLLGGRLDDGQVAGTRALAMARGRGQRGDEACALHLLGDVTAHREGDPEGVERHLRAAVDLAEELAMRPLVARCRLTLARFYRRAGERDRADHELKAAVSQFRQLGMRFWLARAEAGVPSRDAAPSAGRGDAPSSS
ncbi:MAG TPA: adenylate/guanylate cyclase domain-containing protein [Candidatus Dormibacteraeota bacterium]|nr:adenylate/guanylate cyclase domain-containing protein [Candidatus Dormibacteraeota bacterium]